MIVRALLVIVAALLLATQIVRNAAVAALSRVQPHIAARFWAAHPQVEISLGMAEIGAAARARKPVDAATFAMIDDAARKSLLASEPFLVRGVQAENDGNGKMAELAFLAAQWRDPRSLPAAYFLANYALTTHNTLEALQQTAVLARLSPAGGSAAVPFIAYYAQDPANWRQMRELFRSQDNLEDPVLTALARDGKNADAILAIADAAHRRADSPWLPALLQSLVASGDYSRARKMWSAIGGGSDDELIYDPGFSSPGPPPPFNWSFATSGVGLAERQPGKRLHVIFYGSEDGVLATQLLTLAPGAYQLQMQLAGVPVHPETFQWSLRCDKSQSPVASIGLADAATHGWTFKVPANCPAQWLELSGRSGDISQQSEVMITGLALRRTGASD